MILSGGTGGHVFPALAVAENLRAQGNQVFWMGTQKGLEARVVPAAGIPIDWLAVSGFRGKRGVSRLLAPVLLVVACIQAAWILFRRKPDVVLGMGGFVSGPGGLMAWLARIPLVVHEQNTVPGTTNRWLSAHARRVLEAFPGSFDGSVGAICTGNPLRNRIAGLAQSENGSCDGRFNLLVIGGSQGAAALNESVPAAVRSLERPVSIWHQTGEVMRERVAREYSGLELEARVDSFIEDMPAAYTWADLVVCRSGAMTISEVAAAGLPSVLIPFPYAIDDHQTRNAHFLVDAGAAVLIPQTDLDPGSLADILRMLCSDRNRIRSMGRVARKLAKPAATQMVADYCLAEAI